MKKLLFYFFISLLFSSNLLAQPKSVYVVDVNNNNILYARNEESVVSIASITKLMTALIIVEQDLPLDETIEITQQDVFGTYLKGKPTYSRIGIGSKYTREQLLQLALTSSQNRAAYALARTSKGGLEDFIEQMNKKAAEIGMEHSLFEEPTGLSNKNVSTAKDLVILLNYIKENHPLIAEYSTKPLLNFSKRSVFNTTNKLIHSKDWDIYIQKTGFINEAGKCVAMLANVAKRQVAIVILGASSNTERFIVANDIKHFIETGTFTEHKKQKNTKKQHKR